MTAERILFLDEDHPHTLHMAGALIRHGYQVDILSAVAHPRPPYHRGSLRVITAPPASDRQYLDAVASIAAPGSYRHILPMSDTTLRACLEDRPWTTCVFPPVARDHLELLLDKRRTCEFAARHGVLTPAIRDIEGADSLSHAAREFGFPLVVKGVSGEGSGVNVLIVHSLAEAEEAVSAIRHRTQQAPYLQQYVQGTPYLAGGLFADGVPLRLFAAEITQQSPDKTGPAVRLRSSDDAELMKSFCAVINAVKWTGFAQADYVRDEGGRFAFLEVNPRPWGSIAAAARVGVDFFAPLVQLFHGETPQACLGFPSGRDIALFPQRVRAHLRSSRAFVRRWIAAASDLASWNAMWHTDPQLIGPYLRWMIYRRRDLVRRLELDAR